MASICLPACMSSCVNMRAQSHYAAITEAAGRLLQTGFGVIPENNFRADASIVLYGTNPNDLLFSASGTQVVSLACTAGNASDTRHGWHLTCL